MSPRAAPRRQPADHHRLGNIITGDQFGIFTPGGPVTVNGQKQNVYRDVATDLGSTPSLS